MAALALQRLVAFPFQRDVEERKLAHVIIAGENARTGVLQHVAGGQMFAQIHRKVEPVRRELGAQFQEIVLGQLLFAKLRAGVEEIELDQFVDRRLHAGEAARVAAGKHGDRGARKQRLQPADRRQSR